MEELKRCPFCGGYSWLISSYDHRDGQWYFYAECTQCGVEQRYYSKSKEEAIEKWDRREPSTQQDIVHCRECVYGEPKGKYGCKLYHYQRYETHDMGSYDFCSKGKMRLEE